MSNVRCSKRLVFLVESDDVTEKQFDQLVCLGILKLTEVEQYLNQDGRLSWSFGIDVTGELGDLLLRLHALNELIVSGMHRDEVISQMEGEAERVRERLNSPEFRDIIRHQRGIEEAKML